MDSIKKNFLVFSILLLILSHSILKAEEEEIALQAVADQILNIHNLTLQDIITINLR